jgi:hypothetical protein
MVAKHGKVGLLGASSARAQVRVSDVAYPDAPEPFELADTAEHPPSAEENAVNTRTIAIAALVIAVIVLLFLVL